MKPFFFLAILSVLFLGCKGQDKPKDQTKHISQGKNPKVDIEVNKKYDNKGKLIKYDSTYSLQKTAKGRDSIKIDMDSIFQNFKSIYRDNFSKLNEKNFNDLFLSDSLFQYDFLNEDYFKKRFELNTKKFDELFGKMDSLKLNFLDRNNISYPKAPKKKS